MGEYLWREEFRKRCVLSLEWKRVGVMDGESDDNEIDEPTSVE